MISAPMGWEQVYPVRFPYRFLRPSKAYIGNDADVQAMKDVEVRAESAEDVLSIAIAIAGSGTVSVAGTVSVVAIVNTTYAFIDGYAVVEAGGNILVSAADATDVD